MASIPNLDDIRKTAQSIAKDVIVTPTLPYYGSRLSSLGVTSEVFLKLELLQRTGSFKARGAVSNVLCLNDTQRAAGITAFSAGNHAIATAYAARVAGISAKVAMPETANPYRVKMCRELGAEVVFAADIAALVDIVEGLKINEGRTLIHPFEGVQTTLGTATVGLEFCEQTDSLDAVIVPVGGGGLISGVASAVKQLLPDCAVYGVEPDGACGMSDSLTAGAPLPSVKVNTIADSLGAPLHMPYSFSVVRETVDEIFTVSDAELVASMKFMFEDLKLAVEPAAASALAALAGPLAGRLAGKRVGLVICGSNIDVQTHRKLLDS